jgi:hypothetical protein
MLTVITGETLPEELRSSHNVIIVGQPADLPILAELGEALPAPFEEGSNLATERSMRVLYRLTDNTRVGYLESISLPWNRSHAAVAVLGSDAEALRQAGAAITDPSLRQDLKGNLAIINGEQIASSAEKLLLSSSEAFADANIEVKSEASLAPAMETAVSEQEVSTDKTAAVIPAVAIPVSETASASEQPDWLLPLLAASIVLMAIVAFIGIRTVRRQRC